MKLPKELVYALKAQIQLHTNVTKTLGETCREMTQAQRAYGASPQATADIEKKQMLAKRAGNDTRYLLLAYAYARGKPYKTTELKCHHRPNEVFIYYAIREIAGGEEYPYSEVEKIRDWRLGAKEGYDEKRDEASAQFGKAEAAGRKTQGGAGEAPCGES